MVSRFKGIGEVAKSIAAVIGIVIIAVNLGPCSVSWKFVTSTEAQAAHKTISDEVDSVARDLAEHKARDADVYNWTEEVVTWVRDQKGQKR